MSFSLISCDCGVHSVALAYWYRCTLHNCYFFYNESLLQLAKEVQQTFKVLHTNGLSHLVIEKPQVYSSCHQKGDQNDLINLSIVCGVVISEAARLNIDLIIYTPHEWKGSRPKTIDNKYTLSLLTNDEKKAFEHSVIKTAKSKRHNVIDAIGIGLKFLDRR